MESRGREFTLKVALSIESISEGKYLAIIMTRGLKQDTVSRNIFIVFKLEDVAYAETLHLSLQAFKRAIGFNIAKNMAGCFIDAFVLFPALDLQIQLLAHA